MRVVVPLLCAVSSLCLAATPAAPPAVPKIERWTCPTDKELRMLEKGACPLCTTELVKVTEPMRGPSAAGDPYPLATCPVSGQPLGSMGAPIVMQIDGREVRFCCKGCIGTFKKDAAAHWKKIDEAIVKQQKDAYPLDVCVVSKAKLGSMGEPVEHVHRNRLVRFCCRSCVKTLEREPDAFLARLDAAVIEKEKKAYPLDTCIVMKAAKLDSMGEPYDVVLNGRLVRFCCDACLADYWAEPAKHAEALAKARHDRGAGADADKPGGDDHDAP